MGWHLFGWVIGATALCLACKFVFGILTGGRLGPLMYCPQCGLVAQGKIVPRGRLRLEILLWCCGVVPGLLYSIWRVSASRVCASCYHAGLLRHDPVPPAVETPLNASSPAEPAPEKPARRRP